MFQQNPTLSPKRKTPREDPHAGKDRKLRFLSDVGWASINGGNDQEGIYSFDHAPTESDLEAERHVLRYGIGELEKATLLPSNGRPSPSSNPEHDTITFST